MAPRPLAVKNSITISPSQIEDFRLCPLRWRYNQLDMPKGPTSMSLLRGTAVHDSWEVFANSPVKNRSSDLLQANLSLAWHSLEAEELLRISEAPEEIKAWQKARAESSTMLKNYWDEFGLDAAVVGGRAEETLTKSFQGFDLQARLDYRVRANIFELKTSGRSPNRLFYTYFLPQLRYQALLAADQVGGGGITVFITVLWPSGAERLEKFVTSQELDRTHREVERLGKEMIEASRMSQKEIEERAHEGYHCTFCKFFDPCRRRLGGGETDIIDSQEKA